MSEDCLTLNVGAPCDNVDRVPLSHVWIYGGALVRANTPQYPTDALAAQGVVAVSMSYRLEQLAFLPHPRLRRTDTRGNSGYMDQRAAFKWVQHNVAAFGGDPNQVPIYSAVGGSV